MNSKPNRWENWDEKGRMNAAITICISFIAITLGMALVPQGSSLVKFVGRLFGG